MPAPRFRQFTYIELVNSLIISMGKSIVDTTCKAKQRVLFNNILNKLNSFKGQDIFEILIRYLNGNKFNRIISNFGPNRMAIFLSYYRIYFLPSGQLKLTHLLPSKLFILRIYYILHA